MADAKQELSPDESKLFDEFRQVIDAVQLDTFNNHIRPEIKQFAKKLDADLTNALSELTNKFKKQVFDIENLNQRHRAEISVMFEMTKIMFRKTKVMSFVIAGVFIIQIGFTIYFFYKNS